MAVFIAMVVYVCPYHNCPALQHWSRASQLIIFSNTNIQIKQTRYVKHVTIPRTPYKAGREEKLRKPGRGDKMIEHRVGAVTSVRISTRTAATWPPLRLDKRRNKQTHNHHTARMYCECAAGGNLHERIRSIAPGERAGKRDNL